MSIDELIAIMNAWRPLIKNDEFIDYLIALFQLCEERNPYSHSSIGETRQ